MRLYLEYILSNRRLSKAVRRQSRTGFTLTELIVSASIMLIAAMIAGNGLVNLLRSNYKANADSDLRNSLNRSLEFIRQEVRRSAQVVSSSVDKNKLPNGAIPIFSFYIADPADPTRMMRDQITYYVLKSDNPWNNSQNSPVLWRYGPPFDAEGNYSNLEDTGKWQMSAVVYDLNPDISPDDDDCEPIQGSEYLGVTAEVENNRLEFCLAVKKSLTQQTADGSSEEVKHAIKTAFTPLSSNDSTFVIIPPDPDSNSAPPPPPTPPDPDFDIDDVCSGPRCGEAIVPKNPSVVEPKELTSPTPCTGNNCTLDFNDLSYSLDKGAAVVPAGSQVYITAYGLSSMGGNNVTVTTYTKDSGSLPSYFTGSLTNSQVIVELYRTRDSGSRKKGEIYSFLVTITPKTN